MARKTKYLRRHTLTQLTNEEILILETALAELERSSIKFPRDIFEPLRKEISGVYKSIRWEKPTYALFLLLTLLYNLYLS